MITSSADAGWMPNVSIMLNEYSSVVFAWWIPQKKKKDIWSKQNWCTLASFYSHGKWLLLLERFYLSLLSQQKTGFSSWSFPCLLKTTVPNLSRNSEFNSLMLFHTSLSAVIAVWSTAFQLGLTAPRRADTMEIVENLLRPLLRGNCLES